MAESSFTGEQCAGCGQFAPQQPISGIMATEDASGTIVGKSADGNFCVVPVCAACHTDPSRRQRMLKAHFFESRAQALSAVGLAGVRDAAGNPQRVSKSVGKRTGKRS